MECDYKLHDQILDVSSASKYLGVTISNDLTWSQHIQSTVNKGNSAVGFLRRNFRECTPTVKAATVKTMVRPVLEYASTVWDTTDAGDIADLEMVQRRAARFVHNNYTDRTPGCVTDMLNTLRWEPLSQRRANSRLIMLYRIMNNLVDINASDFVNRA